LKFLGAAIIYPNYIFYARDTWFALPGESDAQNILVARRLGDALQLICQSRYDFDRSFHTRHLFGCLGFCTSASSSALSAIELRTAVKQPKRKKELTKGMFGLTHSSGYTTIDNILIEFKRKTFLAPTYTI
jgi:hypothetical protein